MEINLIHKDNDKLIEEDGNKYTFSKNRITYDKNPTWIVNE